MERKHYWNNAFWGGTYLGGAALLYIVVEFLLGDFEKGFITSIPAFFLFFMIIYLQYTFAKKNTGEYNAMGVSFGYAKSFGFMLLIGILAGVIMGVGMYLMQRYVAPEYYDVLHEEKLRKIASQQLSGENLEIAKMVAEFFRTFVGTIIAGIFAMVFYSGITGILVAAFTKKEVSPFVDINSQSQENQSDIDENSTNENR